MSEKSSLAQMLTIARYQFLNYVRSRRLFILLGITVIISVIFMLVIHIYVNPERESPNDFVGRWVSFVTLLIALSALFFGGDALSGEYGKKTAYFLFPNPLKRWTIFWGKFLASLIASLLVVLLYWGIALADTYIVKGRVEIEAFYSLALSLLYLLSLLAFTYMFSSFFKNSAVSITIIAILYFFVFSIVDSISMFTGMEPWFSITYGGQVISNILKDPYPTHVGKIATGGMSITIYNTPLYLGIGIILGYFIISAIIGTIIITYREIK